MTTVVFALAGATVLLGIGILIGSGLNIRAVDQRYRRVAQRVREANEREEAILWLATGSTSRPAPRAEIPHPRGPRRPGVLR